MFILLILYGVTAVGFSFYCSIAEAVLLSITPAYIASLKEKGAKSAYRLEALKKNIDRPLAAILTLNTIAHTVGAAGVGASAAEIWGSTVVAVTSAIMTLVILVVSEIIPKTIGAIYWRTLAPTIGRSIDVLIKILYPLVIFSELLTRLISRGKKKTVITRNEVAAMATLSAKEGQLDIHESSIFQNLLQLGYTRVTDVMTPRTVIIALSQDMTIQEVIEQHPKLPVSRVPIYDGTIDKVTGFVLKMDLVGERSLEERSRTQLFELRRDLRTILGSTTLLQLLKLLLNHREHIALVVDPNGGTEGLVTMEDLLETLFGTEIVDESDEVVDMRKLAEKKWLKRKQRNPSPTS